MAEPGTRASRPMTGGGKKCADADDVPDMALGARHDVEEVAIEAVNIGDYVLLDPSGRPASACCVIAKCAKTNERTARVVGWLLELTGGRVAWWPRRALVWRRRISVSA